MQPLAAGLIPAAADVVDRWVAAVNAGDPTGLDALYAPDYVDHDPLPGQPPGVAGVRSALEALWQQAEHIRFHVEDSFAVGEQVAYRVFGTWSVPHQFVFQDALGPWPTVELRGVGIYRCRGGLLAERWGAWDIRSEGQRFLVQAGGAG